MSKLITWNTSEKLYLRAPKVTDLDYGSVFYGKTVYFFIWSLHQNKETNIVKFWSSKSSCDSIVIACICCQRSNWRANYWNFDWCKWAWVSTPLYCNLVIILYCNLAPSWLFIVCIIIVLFFFLSPNSLLLLRHYFFQCLNMDFIILVSSFNWSLTLYFTHK